MNRNYYRARLTWPTPGLVSVSRHESGGIEFSSDEEHVLKSLTNRIGLDELKTCHKRRKKCIGLKRDYVEKWKKKIIIVKNSRLNSHMGNYRRNFVHYYTTTVTAHSSSVFFNHFWVELHTTVSVVSVRVMY